MKRIKIMNKPRLTIRLTPSQMQVLDELKGVLNCNISLLMRAIIGDWLQKNEKYIYEIIDGIRPFDKDWIKNNNETESEEDDDE